MGRGCCCNEGTLRSGELLGGLVKPWTEEDRRKGFDATVGVVEIPDDRSRKTPTSPHRSSRISPKCSSFPRTHRRDVTPPTPPYFHHASFSRGVLGAWGWCDSAQQYNSEQQKYYTCCLVSRSINNSLLPFELRFESQLYAVHVQLYYT